MGAAVLKPQLGWQLVVLGEVDHDAFDPPRRAKPRRGGTATWLRRLDRAWHGPVDDETDGVGATGDKATSRPYDGHVRWDIN
jgi:hypothetical protein